MTKTLEHRGGCLCCPGTRDLLSMDTELYNDFGGYTIYKNGEHFFSEDPGEDKKWGENKKLHEIEKVAKRSPKSKWEVVLILPLRGATWTRNRGKWILTDTNLGFA